MNAQNSANHILVDLDAKSQRDLLSNAWAAPFGVALLHGNDSVDEVLIRSLRARAAPASGREQNAVLSFAEQAVKMQQRGRFQNYSRTENTSRADKMRAHAEDDPIGGSQVGSALATAIEDQQLMPNEDRFGNNGTESAGSCQSRHGHDQMNK